MLLGPGAMRALSTSRVAVFGVGGVGSFAAEALARSGVGEIAVFDNDEVCVSNINRQLIASFSTVGRKKVEVMRDRILDINPDCRVDAHAVFYSAENANEYDLSGFSYIIDAIDTVSSKLTLIENARAAGVPVISCMGAGNKLDPTAFEVSDIYKTSVCPLAKVMRRELRARGIPSLKVVYSREMPIQAKTDAAADMRETGTRDHRTPAEMFADAEEMAGEEPHGRRPGSGQVGEGKRRVPGSISFVPSVAGMILAGEVIRDITGIRPG